MGFLTEIVVETRLRLRDQPLDPGVLTEAIVEVPEARDLAGALRASAEQDGVAVIAEVKRSSPSAGTIAGDVDPVRQAAAYEEGGAAAISVLTEPGRFDGSLEDLEAVRAATRRPVVRKDFLLDPLQVIESRAAGADSVLLITACLDDAELIAMLEAARSFGMEPLVEAHGDKDLERALGTDARIVGVNARDLETLQVDLPAALERLPRIPRDRVAVLESGIARPDDVMAAVDAGASAVLVGETLMRAGDPRGKLRELLGGVAPAPSPGRGR